MNVRDANEAARVAFRDGRVRFLSKLRCNHLEFLLKHRTEYGSVYVCIPRVPPAALTISDDADEPLNTGIGFTGGLHRK
jgi:hypothetical protein